MRRMMLFCSYIEIMVEVMKFSTLVLFPHSPACVHELTDPLQPLHGHPRFHGPQVENYCFQALPLLDLYVMPDFTV